MKLYVSMFMVFAGLVTASLGAGAQSEGSTGGVVTVYTHRHYEADQAIFDNFTKATGIRVQVLKGDADQLIQRIKSEGASSPADILITADVGRLAHAQSLGLLKPTSSRILSGIPAHLRDPQGNWFGLTKRARVIVYDKSKGIPSIRTYEELAQPSWAGKILVRSSSNVYNISLIAGLLDRFGPTKTQEWARGLAQNLARPPQGGDRDQMKALVAGEGTLAITNTYYIGQLLGSTDAAERAVGEKIGIIFPDQEGRGTHINVSGAGVLRTSPNPQAALKLLEYLVGPEAQSIFAAGNYEYPVIPGVALSPMVAAWGTFKEDPLSLSILGTNSAQALSIADRAGWK